MTRGQWRTIEVLALLGMFFVAGVLLLPYVRAARDNARQMQCLNHLRLIAEGANSFEMMEQSFPQGTRPNPRLPPEKRLSWYLNHWSIFGDGQLHVEVDWDGAWDVPQNLRIKTKNIDGVQGELGALPYLDCPSRPGNRDRVPSLTAYLGVAGVGVDPAAGPLIPASGVFGYDRVCRVSDVADGLSATLLLIETGDRNGPWTAGGPSTVRGYDEGPSPLGVGRPFGGMHPGKTAVSMADASARLLSNSMDPQALANLMTIGEKQAADAPAAGF